MDLRPYTAKGFPGDFDAMLADIAVKGIDREQSQGAVRVCPETETELYEGGYSPTRIRYRRGSRPVLESVVSEFAPGGPFDLAQAAMDWVYRNVAHPHQAGPLLPDRAMTEEQIIASRVGWCNEQARVFIALCEIMSIPARLCFLFHANGRASHTAAEAYIHERWAFFDPTFAVFVTLPSGEPAEGRDLSGTFRQLAHASYAPALEEHYANLHPFVEDLPGWGGQWRPRPDRGGDLLEALGISNYITEGVVAEQ